MTMVNDEARMTKARRKSEARMGAFKIGARTALSARSWSDAGRMTVFCPIWYRKLSCLADMCALLFPRFESNPGSGAGVGAPVLHNDSAGRTCVSDALQTATPAPTTRGFTPPGPQLGVTAPAAAS